MRVMMFPVSLLIAASFAVALPSTSKIPVFSRSLSVSSSPSFSISPQKRYKHCIDRTGRSSKINRMIGSRTLLSMTPLSLLEETIYGAQSANLRSLSVSLGKDINIFNEIKPLAAVYAAGLLAAFSPCSLSILPLTLSYISDAAVEGRRLRLGGRGDYENLSENSDELEVDKSDVLFPSFAFAAGLASVFCILGLSATFFGGVFGGGFGDDDSPVLKLLGSAISLIMGLRLLDILDFPLPSFEFSLPWENDTTNDGSNNNIGDDSSEFSEIQFDEEGNMLPPPAAVVSSSISTTSTSSLLFRTFLLGGTSALIASPCATSVLATVLAYVATSSSTGGTPFFGTALLLSYSSGYVTPLLAAGVTGGKFLATARTTAEENSEEQGEEGGGGLMATAGRFVTPLTAAVLLWYGTGGILEGLYGDPSLAGLAPIFE